MALSETATQKISVIESSVLRVLLYFDVFNYPLTAEEVKKYANTALSLAQTNEALSALWMQNRVYKFGPFYSVQNKPELEQQRNQGMARATELMKKAHKYAALIHQFPFVRSVCISGSLSKGCVDELGDIDYFIITKPQRLWIARTLLVLFKKLFLFNSHKYFCVNYFVDTNHLEIPDKNIFTSTEIATLIPMSGGELFKQFHASNNWYFSFLPNTILSETNHINESVSITKRLLEFLLNGFVGQKLDTWFMQLTIKRWKGKFKSFSADELDIALRSRKYVSKHHPQNFQLRVINKFQENITKFEQKHLIKLHG